MATGRTGADAIFRALHAICGTLKRYRPKLETLIDSLVSTGVLTAAQGATVNDFIATSSTLCDLFGLIASHSGF